MSKLEITVGEHGTTILTVDGEPVGLLNHLEFTADADEGPKVKAKFIKFGSAEEHAERLLKLPYAEVEWVE